MKDIIYQSNFPIKVLINGKDFIQYSAFSVKRSITQFIDTFSITCNNPYGSNSTSISVGSVVSFWYNEVEVFRGYIEQKNATMAIVGSYMTLSGREEIVSICEDDIDPQQAQFKKTTDNAIITKLLADKGYILDLGTAYPVKEISGSVGMKIAQLVEDTTKYSDCIIMKKGKFLIKRKIPTGPTGNIIPLRITKESGQFTIYNSKVLDIKMSENITQAKGYMMGNSYETGKKKKGIYAKTENKVMTSGLYGRKLRNLSKLIGTPIKYTSWFQSTAKEQSEAQTQTKRAQRETDIKISVTLTVSGFFDVQLLDTVDVFIEQEKIQQYMYVSSIEYIYASNNKTTTMLELTPYPSL